jgi:hypothetical protein
MPYIKQEQRDLINKEIENLVFILRGISTSKGQDGMVNYAITEILSGVYNVEHSNYATHKDAMGTWICALLEYYIEVVHPYETVKKEANGDVYQPKTSY